MARRRRPAGRRRPPEAEMRPRRGKTRKRTRTRRPCEPPVSPPNGTQNISPAAAPETPEQRMTNAHGKWAWAESKATRSLGARQGNMNLGRFRGGVQNAACSTLNHSAGSDARPAPVVECRTPRVRRARRWREPEGREDAEARKCMHRGPRPARQRGVQGAAPGLHTRNRGLRPASAESVGGGARPSCGQGAAPGLSVRAQGAKPGPARREHRGRRPARLGGEGGGAP
jgi:hypothetical protein